MDDKKANHVVPIVRIGETFPIPGADKIVMTKVSGYELVIPKTMQTGDLAVFIQPDSIVPQTEPFKFIWGPFVGLDGIVPERRRRITVRRFKKQYSEGLLLPVTDFTNLEGSIQYDGDSQWVGADVSDILGITHYDPDAEREARFGGVARVPRRKYPRSIKGWFFYILYKLGLYGRDGMKGDALDVKIPVPQYDVDALKNFSEVFTPEDQVIVTEKIHGCNARYICVDGTMYMGSRTQWKDPESDTWWRRALADNPLIEQLCRKNEGYALYGEVTHDQVQSGFSYGSDKYQFFLFDILDPEGKWVDKDQTLGWADIVGLKAVPVLYEGMYNLEAIKKVVDGPSQVTGAKNIREGVVISAVPEAENQFRLKLGRKQLKLVSNLYYERNK